MKLNLKEKNKMKFNIRNGAGDSTKPNLKVREQDNLYLAVNSKWMEENPIPADRPWQTSFDVVEEKGRNRLLNDLESFATRKVEIPAIKNFHKVVAFYEIARDANKREVDGADPIKEDLEFLLNLKDLNDVNQNIKKLFLDYILPFKLTVIADFKNAQLNVVNFERFDPILQDPSYYGKDNTKGLLAIWQKQTENLLTMAGVDETAATQYAQDALKLDQRLVKFYNSAQFNAKMENIYNPVSVADFEDKSKYLNLTKLLQECNLEDTEFIIVNETNYLDHFSELFNENNFAELKGWLISLFINYTSYYLSRDFRKAAMPLTKALWGIDSISSDERYAYQQTKAVFDDVLGQFYGRKYLGEEAKRDATEIVKNMIQVYKKRLSENDWLTETTKKQAIKKLDTMILKIAYPDHVQKFYDLFKVKQDGNLYENVKVNKNIKKLDNLAHLHQPVDHTVWGFSPIEANACYDPSNNDITLPALILQKPFYDLKQDRAANYGGFGTVIGHEISHAFDNNGSQFDEKGNMKNWWTKQDYDEFNKRIKAEIALFDGVKVGEIRIDGELTVSENIGDQGGLTVAVASNKQENGDMKILFENFARVWETNAKPEFLDMLAASDVHSLPQARVNVQVQCQPEFYQAFDVKPTDGMWLDPAKRVSIW